VKLADTQDLGSCAERLAGSSPASPTSPIKTSNHWNFSFKNFQSLELFPQKLPGIGTFGEGQAVPG
ncbi:MAG TPA: hypothetical protein P5185_09450, partial [Oscillospiraceae bacterium]|nr:hypothetical protein [Oscillospiraceae bacterium]